MNSTSHVAISSGAESNQKPKLGDSAISMTLNGTKFCLNSEGRWEIESTDLNLATLEIERLLDEKEQLCIALSRAMQQIADLQQEVRDLNNIKSTTLEMLMKETEQRLALEEQIEGYKQKLRESYRVIVEMRKVI